MIKPFLRETNTNYIFNPPPPLRQRTTPEYVNMVSDPRFLVTIGSCWSTNPGPLSTGKTVQI